MKIRNWTAQNIGQEVSGKVAIVTGGNSGLGFEAVKALAQKGAQVIMASRSIAKAEEAKRKLSNSNLIGAVEVFQLDLAQLSSIRKFAENFKEKYQKLDILINNAGIMMPPYQLTKDGFESQIGTNHLGHFALTGLLLDRLKFTPNSRVINVSSIAHKSGELDFENFMYDKGKGYSPMKAYSRSKLCNLLFSFELQRYFESNNIKSSAIAAHPGVSDTNLFNDVLPKWVSKLVKPLASLMVQPAFMGVLPELRAATDPLAKGGEYYGPDGSREMKGFPVVVKPTATAKNTALAKQLWSVSEKLTKVQYA